MLLSESTAEQKCMHDLDLVMEVYKQTHLLPSLNTQSLERWPPLLAGRPPHQTATGKCRRGACAVCRRMIEPSLRKYSRLLSERLICMLGLTGSDEYRQSSCVSSLHQQPESQRMAQR